VQVPDASDVRVIHLSIVRNRSRFTAALAITAVVAALLPMLAPVGAQAAAPSVVRATAPNEVPSGWTWTNYGPELMSVACATPQDCVAVGQGGAVLRSPNTDDIPLAWTFVDLKKDPKFPDNPVDLVSVTCSDTSCLAVSAPLTPTVSYGSWVYRSTDGGATWAAVQQLPAVGTRSTNVGTAVTCAPDAGATPGTRVCYIAGDDGGIWRSDNDGRSWTGVPLPKTAPATASFDKVACASAGFCVVAGGDASPSSALVRGTTVTMLDTPIGIDKRFAALACDGPSRCVATGGQGNYTVMNVGPVAAWGTAYAFRKNPLQAGVTVKVLVCPVENSCLGLDGDGDALRTDALGTPGTAWRMRPAPAIISALACFTTSCVGVGKAAAWYQSFDLGGGFGRVNEVAKFDVAVCGGTLEKACIAGGTENIGRSVTGGTLWSLPIADRGAFNTKAIRCSSSVACSFFGQFQVLNTDDMNVYRPRFGPVQSSTGVDAQTCVTDTVCVGVSESVVYTTLDGGLTQWNSNQFPKVRPMTVSCIPGKTDPVTCFVPNKYNILIGTMTPDAQGLPHWFWRYTNADADNLISAVSCTPGGTLCAASGTSGQVLTSTNSMDWAQQTIPVGVPVGSLPDYTSVTCPSDGFCMLGGKQGVQSIVASTLDGFATYSYDEIGDLRAAPGVTGFGCESVNRCVAVGSTVLLGIRNPPAPTPAS
jgi:hypothetical protein